MYRFAPCPTADLHIDDLRIALINYIGAQQNNDGFFIRIEDFNQNLAAENKEQETIDILKKFAIDTENIIHQSKNLNIYRQLAAKLVKEEKAFARFCSDETLDNTECFNLTDNQIQKRITSGEKYSIHIKKPESQICFKDLIQGKVTTKPDEIDSFIIMDEKGIPTYNFACSIDDMSTNISTIVSTLGYISDTMQQIHIRNSLGYDADIEYAHLPLMTGDKNSTSSVKWLLQEGFLPDAIINYLLLLGNNTQKDIFYLPDAIEWLDLHTLSKSPVKFDIEHLRSINRKHLQAMESKKLSSIFGFADSEIGELLKLYLEESATINELDIKIKSIFALKECKGGGTQSIKLLSSIILDAPILNDFSSFKNYLIQRSGLKEEELLKPLQILLSGCENGPKPDIIYPFIKPYLLEIARCR